MSDRTPPPDPPPHRYSGISSDQPGESPGETEPPESSPAALRTDGPPYTSPWSILDAIAAVVLWFLLAVIIGGTFVYIARTVMDGIYVDALAVAFGSIAVSASVVIWLSVRNPRWIKALFGVRRPTPRDFVIAVAAGITMFVILILGLGNLLQLIINASGGEAPPVQEGLQELVRDPRTAWILLLSTVILAPLGEELLFRGVLVPAIRKHLGSWPAIGISGLLFAMIHFEATTAGYLLVILVLFPAGMAFARLYESRGTLWVPIVAHSVFNLIQVSIALLSGDPL